MIRHTSIKLTVTFWVAVIGMDALIDADDRHKPQPVSMTKKPLTTEQAQAAQKEWADWLGSKVIFKNSIDMQLSVIPPGTFLMGSPPTESDRKKGEAQRKVTLSQPFFMGRYEVTQSEWERVMGPIKRKRTVGKGERFPVYGINHAEAAEFCRKLSEIDRKNGKLPTGFAYRLPTDAEWEFACRAGTTTATYFGNQLGSRQANFDGNRPYNGAEKGPNLGQTARVGSYPANAWGLHDMHGNLCEWCLDWYYDSAKGGTDPVQLTPAKQRLIRDGRFGYWGRYCRSANRYFAGPNDRRTSIGLRPILTKIHWD